MDDEIDPDELADLLDRGVDVRIVDIRDRRAFDRGHLPGSESIPFPELTTRVTELEGADRIVTVCPHGIASRQAARLVGSYAGTVDARVESLHGGIEAWERSSGELIETDAREASERGSDERGDGERGTESSPVEGSVAPDDEGPDAPF